MKTEEIHMSFSLYLPSAKPRPKLGLSPNLALPLSSPSPDPVPVLVLIQAPPEAPLLRRMTTFDLIHCFWLSFLTQRPLSSQRGHVTVRSVHVFLVYCLSQHFVKPLHEIYLFIYLS